MEMSHPQERNAEVVLIDKLIPQLYAEDRLKTMGRKVGEDEEEEAEMAEVVKEGDHQEEGEIIRSGRGRGAPWNHLGQFSYF